MVDLGVTWTWNRFEVELVSVTFLNNGRAEVAYRFYDLDTSPYPIFEGEDYSPAPVVAVDGLESVMGLLGFLTLKPGDTDEEFFNDYSEEQLAWCQSDRAEELALLVSDYEDHLEISDFFSISVCPVCEGETVDYGKDGDTMSCNWCGNLFERVNNGY